MQEKKHFQSEIDELAKYLIIAATTKSATTSLYTYLAHHPQIAAQIMKENGYWLDEQYPSKIGNRYTSSLTYSDDFSPTKDDQIRLDVTPDYLYSYGTPTRLLNEIKNIQLFFSLREPISRVISKYRYLKQQDRLPHKKMSINEYVDVLLELKYPLSYECPQNLRTLEQGNYIQFLNSYIKTFDTSVLHIIYYEDIKKDPLSITKKICEVVGIDPDFYNDYSFPVVNKTRNIESKQLERSYHRFRKYLSSITDPYPHVHSLGRKAKKIVQPLVYYLNGDTDNHNVYLAPQQFEALQEYYRSSVIELNQFREVPDSWKEIYFI